MSNLSLNHNRAQTALLAANLYKAHKIDKKLTEISGLHKISIGVQVANLKLTSQIATGINQIQKTLNEQQKMMRAEQANKEKVKILKDVFFDISEELEEIKQKEYGNLEKFFYYSSLSAELKKHDIDSSLVESFEEKKLINNTVKDLDECINNTDKLLSDEEKKDQNIILEILENDEETEMYRIARGYAFREHDVYTRLKKIFSDPNAPPESYLFDYSRSDLITLTKEHTFDRVYFEGFWTAEKNYEILHNQKLDLFHDYKNIFKNFLPIAIINLGKKKAEKLLDLRDEFAMKYKYEKKGIFGTTTVEELHKKFYKKNAKLIDEWKECLLKAVDEYYEGIPEKYEKEVVRLNSLTKDIAAEKEKMQPLYKKYNFLEQLVPNRK